MSINKKWKKAGRTTSGEFAYSGKCNEILEAKNQIFGMRINPLLAHLTPPRIGEGNAQTMRPHIPNITCSLLTIRVDLRPAAITDVEYARIVYFDSSCMTQSVSLTMSRHFDSISLYATLQHAKYLPAFLILQVWSAKFERVECTSSTSHRLCGACATPQISSA